MWAVVALLRGVVHRVDVEGVIRTGLHARFAPDTKVGVEVDDAVVAFEKCAGGANGDTRCVRAVITAENGEEPLGVGPGSLLDVLDPGSVDSERDLMLGLACDRAGVTADAEVLIDDEAVFQDTIQSVTEAVPFEGRLIVGQFLAAFAVCWTPSTRWRHYGLISTLPVVSRPSRAR